MAASPLYAIDRHVGPGQTYATIGAVPWHGLAAGDTVYIHYRSTPYREKFLISGHGTPGQWIRVLGVLGPNGERPIISGDRATTSSQMRHRPGDAEILEPLGVVHIAVNGDAEEPELPGYIEIANLQIQDGYSTYQFTRENGRTVAYDRFAACIYARSVQHLIVRDSVLTNCGQGFYNWTGDGSGGGHHYWDGVAADITLRGNYFHNNGGIASYLEHQVYTEADGVVIEHNRFGPQRAGSLGSQVTDRSAGTIIRYNYIEQSAAGWDLDLVESQEGFKVLSARASYRQTWVYGNVIVNKSVRAPSMIHWNEDHNEGTSGRATFAGSKLFFYNNTVLTVMNRDDMDWPGAFSVFNTEYGGYDCPPGPPPPGVIDVRNNLFVTLPRTAGSPIPILRFGYCSSQNFSFGKNWVSPGWKVWRDEAAPFTGAATGQANIVSPAANVPGFVDVATNDLHLLFGSSPTGIGGALAPEVTTSGNSLGAAMPPNRQYVYHQQATARPSSGGVGSDVGAFDANPAASTRAFPRPFAAGSAVVSQGVRH